jgi:hypothetical protein
MLYNVLTCFFFLFVESTRGCGWNIPLYAIHRYYARHKQIKVLLLIFAELTGKSRRRKKKEDCTHQTRASFETCVAPRQKESRDELNAVLEATIWPSHDVSNAAIRAPRQSTHANRVFFFKNSISILS